MPQPILEVSGLQKHYLKGQNKVVAVKNVGFKLMPGESFGLVGESGCGKSSLAKLLTHLEKPDAGQIILDGTDITWVKSNALRKVYSKIQMVFQDPVASFNPRQRIGDSISEVLANFKVVSRAKRQDAMLDLLKCVGLRPEYARRFPSQLSGGECQRAAIARAIAVRPKVLICDEATSALDMSIQAQILELLHELRDEMGMAFLFISHDISLVSCFCQRIGVMKQGEIVEMGYVREIITHPKHPYTKLLLSSVYRESALAEFA